MTTEKVLAQSKPTAANLTDAYTVPALTSTVVSTILVCNQSAVATTFRISVAKAGAGDTPAQYLYYDYPIEGNITVRLDKLQLTLATTDVVRVYNTLATLSFNIFGSEKS